MPNLVRTRRFGLLIARAAVLLSVAVLVCVPAITRVGQRLETASHTPSFAKNIDCPPKKVTVTPVFASVTPVPLDHVEAAPVTRLPSSADAAPPRSPFIVAPRPLRAPPAARLT